MPTPDNQADLPYWVALARCLKLGPTRWALLRRAFPTMREAWDASARELTQAGLDEATVKALAEHRQTTNVEESWAELKKLQLDVLTIADQAYSALLKQIYDPPAVLFYHGHLAALELPSLAVVGTRAATSYGRRVTSELVRELAQAGLCIISGLAYGIDTEAHRATLEVGGATVAVLAGGLDDIYPTANQSLAKKIVEQGGLLLSEYPPGTASLKQNFPYRNRIIAGLARGTLVTEAAPGSGALLTAKHALEANREVFAVPGSIFSEQSQGTNELLKLGAHLVTKAQDVLDVFGLEAVTSLKLPPPNEAQTALLQHLSSEPTGLDELVRRSGLTAADFTAQLTLLEVAGYVREVGGQKYIRAG